MLQYNVFGFMGLHTVWSGRAAATGALLTALYPLRTLGFFRYTGKLPKKTDRDFGIYSERLLLPSSVSLFLTIRMTVLSETPHSLAVSRMLCLFLTLSSRTLSCS